MTPLSHFTTEHHAKCYEELLDMSAVLLRSEEGVKVHVGELGRLLNRMAGHLAALEISAEDERNLDLEGSYGMYSVPRRCSRCDEFVTSDRAVYWSHWLTHDRSAA